MARKMPYKPPSIDNLASVDPADEYGTELSEILGVVSFGGQGGWPATKYYEVHSFAFAAWRQIGQPLVERELTILRPVPVDGDWLSEYPEGTIHQVRLLLSVDASRAVFAEAIARDVDDVELRAIADELRKPVILGTNRLGSLTLDRRINQFWGKTSWNGVSIDISLETDERLSVSSQLETAEELFANSETWAARIRDFAVAELLQIANEWRVQAANEQGKADAPPITAEAFLRRMKIELVAIKENGEFEFWHNDGDLFFGHSIMVAGSLKEGLTHSDIPG